MVFHILGQMLVPTSDAGKRSLVNGFCRASEVEETFPAGLQSLTPQGKDWRIKGTPPFARFQSPSGQIVGAQHKPLFRAA